VKATEAAKNTNDAKIKEMNAEVLKRAQEKLDEADLNKKDAETKYNKSKGVSDKTNLPEDKQVTETDKAVLDAHVTKHADLEKQYKEAEEMAKTPAETEEKKKTTAKNTGEEKEEETEKPEKYPILKKII